MLSCSERGSHASRSAADCLKTNILDFQTIYVTSSRLLELNLYYIVSTNKLTKSCSIQIYVFYEHSNKEQCFAVVLWMLPFICLILTVLLVFTFDIIDLKSILHIKKNHLRIKPFLKILAVCPWSLAWVWICFFFPVLNVQPFLENQFFFQFLFNDYAVFENDKPKQIQY